MLLSIGDYSYQIAQLIFCIYEMLIVCVYNIYDIYNRIHMLHVYILDLNSLTDTERCVEWFMLILIP